MKKIIEKIIRNPDFLPFILFTFIFIVYFSSAVGLINSGDTPQYFTTESLIKYRDINLTYFKNDPHYIGYPDIYYYKNKELGLRGYLLSVLTIPLHKIGYLLKFLISINNFPSEIKTPNFKYELVVTSLFVIFSAMGLLFIFLILREMIRKTIISLTVIIFMSFGTYVWKYSAFYTRQGLVVFLLGLSTFSLWRYKKNKNRGLLCLFLICWAISFGVDIPLFISISAYLIYMLILIFFANKLNINVYKRLIKTNFKFILIPILIIMINIYFNYRFYGTFLFSQTNYQPHVRKVLGKKSDRAWVSTPLYPTIFVVLFNKGKIPEAAFKNFINLPEEIAKLSSLYYAKQYNFYGLFTISPILYFIFLIFIFRRKIFKNKIIKEITLYSFFIFLLGITINSKVLNFWGGNQYDVRYFYPYVVLLSLPLVLVLDELYRNKKINHIIFLIIFFISGMFSLFMGWLGVINMFKPALTGERKIWMDIYDVPSQLFKHSFSEYLDATFMNRENAWIAVALSITGYIVFRIFLFFMQKIKTSTKKV